MFPQIFIKYKNSALHSEGDSRNYLFFWDLLQLKDTVKKLIASELSLSLCDCWLSLNYCLTYILGLKGGLLTGMAEGPTS